MKKVAIILCNDMHMDIEKANVLLNYISKNDDYEVVTEYNTADIIIIYTCAFGKNKMYSMQVIADVCCNCKAKVIVTGCLLNICKDNLNKIPNILVVPYQELLNRFYKGTIENFVSIVPQNKVIISEGCLHKCSYCVYPLLSGTYKSKKIEQVLDEVERLYETESTIYITGALETSDYGMDLYGKRVFSELIDKIASKYKSSNYVIGWFNISGLTDEVISVISKYKNIVGIMLHLQHVNEKILKNMNRPSMKSTEEKVNKLKAIRPDLQIFTEVIVGFPGETEEDFQELVDYLSKGYFDDIGVASYEAVLGTKAALLPNKVPVEIKNQRMNFIKEKFMATCYPADEHSCKSIIDEYQDTYNILLNRPKNILCKRQKYNKIAGIDTNAKLDELEEHLSKVLKCIVSSRSEYDFMQNKKYLQENYTFEARKLFNSVIQYGDFKVGIKIRAQKILL